MSNQDYTISITSEKSPEAVFAAVINVRAWWSGEIEGETDRLGAEFTYRYKDMHWSRQKVTEFVPGQRVVWNVADSRIAFVRDKQEWNGTDIVFDIARAGDRTELRFTHRGLAPGVECYGDCSGAWAFYIGESLRNLIAVGRGQPNAEKQVAGASAE